MAGVAEQAVAGRDEMPGTEGVPDTEADGDAGAEYDTADDDGHDMDGV